MSTCIELRDQWKFKAADLPDFASPNLDDTQWETVSIPHDWAIAGPFNPDYDTNEGVIVQDGESKPVIHYGRTGSLPYMGVGCYRKILRGVQRKTNQRCFLEFDAVMNNATVWLNGQKVADRPFGYSSFSADVTDAWKDGQDNVLAVRVSHQDNSSRWYPGSGIIRPVRLLIKPQTHIRYHGVWLTDAKLDLRRRTATLNVRLDLSQEDPLCTVKVAIEPQDGSWFRMVTFTGHETQIPLDGLETWSPEHPFLYRVSVQLIKHGQSIDQQELHYGFKALTLSPETGMTLNGKPYCLKGVCLHHDHGPLGAAFSIPAARRQLKLLKDMGCNAVRTSHNPPAPQLLDLCDALGFLVLDEAFDAWKTPKCPNDYSRCFEQWHERDLRDFIRRDRNHPSVFLWSIGNEIMEQHDPNGRKLAARLVRICHDTDPTRLVTAGLDQPESIQNDFPEPLDVVGWNYKPARYQEFHDAYPDKPIFGSETASTVSSRGVYTFPIKAGQPWRERDCHQQCSSFDQEYPPWATTPDQEFYAQDRYPWMFGEFVWTGFDYLGEPTPYYIWPSHSSYFGIFDLAGLPKDRAWLYAARWSGKPVLHLLPHWNWPDYVGKEMPVVAYTNYDHVELFINGVSQGLKHRPDPSTYRLTWEQVTYRPGELLAIARDQDGNELARERIRTAGKPARLQLTADRTDLEPGIADLAYITVKVLDQDGHPVPTANLPVSFTVTGAGDFAAAANGDPTCIVPFSSGNMPTFNGACVAILRAGKIAGTITLSASAPDLPAATITVTVK